MNTDLNRRHTKTAGSTAGMTLVELIVVIVIAGILATVTTSFIVTAATGYTDLARRAELVDAAEMSLRKLGRDVHRALPNSVRVDGTGRAIEMLNTLDGGRYRDGPGVNPDSGHSHGEPKFRLRTGAPDDNGFNIVGFFQQLAVPFSSTTERLAIYNLGATGANAYDDAQMTSGSYVITNPDVIRFSVATDVDGNPGGGDEHQILPVAVTSSSFRFAYASPNQRVFVVDTPVTYLCDPGPNGTITRYWGYAIDAAQPTNPAIAPLAAGSSELLTRPVTACSFTYQPGTAERGGLITLDITVSDADSGERVRLLYQAHVDNAP